MLLLLMMGKMLVNSYFSPVNLIGSLIDKSEVTIDSRSKLVNSQLSCYVYKHYQYHKIRVVAVLEVNQQTRVDTVL